MENQSNPINVGKQEKRIIYCDKKVALWLSDFTHITQNFEFVSKRNSSSLSLITNQNSKIEVSYGGEESFQIPFCIESFSFLLKSLEHPKVETDKIPVAHYKDLEFETRKLLKNCTSLEDLLDIYSCGKLLKGFKNCQFLLHEKGKPEAKSLYSLDSSPVCHEEISVSSYNQIYSKIKKSKNKLFDQTDILASEIKVVGSFLAKEIELPTHTLLIILSRGDFFSPSVLEREHFNKVLLLSMDKLNRLASMSSLREKNLRANELIQSIPFYMKLTSSTLSMQSKSKKSLETISKVVNNLSIEMDSLEAYQSDPDFFHHERLVLMGELLNTLRHELSNPLFGLSISTNLLMSDSFEKDDQINETILEIGKSSQRCQKIIENFAGLYGDRNTNQNIKIDSLINETLTLTKSESRLFRKSIKIDDSCANLTIHTNPTLLSQIIFNLVINSTQALSCVDTKEKIINIEVNRSQSNINLFVQDNGPGVPENKVAKIFEAFYTTKATGTGLGLAICKNLAKQLGGDIEYIKQDLGAKFKITIPIGKNDI